MRMIIVLIWNLILISICLIGLSLVMHGYSTLSPHQMTPDFNEELNEGGLWMMIGFGIMAIGFIRLLAHIESLFVAGCIALAYLYQALYS